MTMSWKNKNVLFALEFIILDKMWQTAVKFYLNPWSAGHINSWWYFLSTKLLSTLINNHLYFIVIALSCRARQLMISSLVWDIPDLYHSLLHSSDPT